MDFFALQEDARRRSGVLVAYFALAVALIVFALYSVAILILRDGEAWAWDPSVFANVAIPASLLIGGGSLVSILSLRSGGAKVAEMLGGRPVDPQTRELPERRLLNVVEEMALAAGVPAPSVYVLPGEPGINAFAAGWSPSDAVVCVTAGALEQLNREELQGVVGHEFSHILNGDMRMNIRLMGWITGILLLAIVGRALIQTLRFARPARRSGKDNSGGILVAIALIGLCMLIIGYIGVFFARLIQAAVARQREYLADASAVQFTRNPSGLAGALKKIAGLPAASFIRHPRAELAGHLFLGAVRRASLFATHPPLGERIRRLDPTFREDDLAAIAAASDEPAAATAEVVPPAAAARTLTTPLRMAPADVVRLVGAPTADHTEFSARWLASLPKPVMEAAHEPAAAAAVTLALLLDRNPAARAAQLAALRAAPDTAAWADAAEASVPLAHALRDADRLPLADLAAPALGRLDRARIRDFQRAVRAAIEADGEVSLFEYALRRQLDRALERQLPSYRPPDNRFGWTTATLADGATLLSALARIAAADETAAAKAFRDAVNELGPVAAGWRLTPAAEAGLDRVDTALAELAGLRPPLKRGLISACLAALLSDGRIAPEEAELFRAVAAALECPVPPWLGLEAAA